MDKLEIGLALDEIFNVLRKCNKYIDDTMPWVLAKEEEKKERLETVLYNLLESIKVCALEIIPFLPETGEEILRQIHAVDRGHLFKNDSIYEVNDPSVLFARIDIPKKLEEIQMKDTL